MILNKKDNVYMVGIKGVGMAMLAQFLVFKGFSVSGSDVEEEFQTNKTLANSKIKVKHGFSLENFPEKIDLVIRSSAFNIDKNIELKHLNKRGVKIITYAEAVGYLFNQYFGISVCGSHGKTTVTSWLGYVLFKSKVEPNVLSGSYVRQFNGSSLMGKSKYFILESDEYQNKLQYFNPQMVVLNNIDFDHPDYFKDEKAYFKVFSDFVKKVPKSGFLVTNIKDKQCLKISKFNQGKNIFYTISDMVNIKDLSKLNYKYLYRAENIKTEKYGQSFILYKNNKSLGKFKIKLMGEHNISNALAVISSCLELRVDLEKIRKNLFLFTGASRRFDVLGVYRGSVIIDDYGHHPTEVKACLQAVKQRYGDKKIITVFHPHTVSRTKALFDDFVKSFELTDSLYLMEIYTSAREKSQKLSSLDLMKKIGQYNLKNNKKQELKYFKNFSDIEKDLRKIASKDKVILLLGAGDIFRVAYKLLNISSKDI
jgi:UDP-N-acetylmuramate--alanine ligase